MGPDHKTVKLAYYFQICTERKKEEKKTIQEMLFTNQESWK